MKRRIALAILLMTWLALLVAALAMYLATRHVLLTDLDDSITARAMALPAALGVASSPTAAPLPQGDRYLVRNDVGQTLARPTGNANQPPPFTVLSRTFTTLADGETMRSLTLSMAKPGATDRLIITYSSSADRFNRLLDRLAIWLAVTAILCALLAAALAWQLSKVALRPLTQAAQIIEQIDQTRLDQRLPTAQLPPELQLMAQRLNDMLARLDRAFAQRRQFLADISHELRTPVAALVTMMEVTLRRPREATQLADTLRNCLGEAQNLRHLVDMLIRQVRREAAGWEEPAQQFDLATLLNSCIESLKPTAVINQTTIEKEIPTSLQVSCPPGRLRSIVTNLLANAVEYTGRNGKVHLRCQTEPNGLTITVCDNGPGITPSLLPALFEPFPRGVPQRSLDNGHLGLGLSIVQAHVTALGGSSTVQSTPGEGTMFRIALPSKLIVQELELAT